MYNLKKATKLYLVYGSNKYQLEVYSDLTASQTFDENSYPVRTLHRQTDYHEAATISRANPGNFSFTSPLKELFGDTKLYSILLKLALEFESGLANFDLYMELENVTYKLTKSVIESVTFNISMSAVITASFSGTFSKLEKFLGTIPGTLVSPGVTIYGQVRRLSVKMDGTELPSIAAINLDVSNEVNWRKNDIVGATLTYPENYVLSGRQISGSVTQFLTSENIDSFSDTSTARSLEVAVYSDDSISPFLTLILPQIVYTRRLGIEDVVNRVYDFRLTSNAASTKALALYTNIKEI